MKQRFHFYLRVIRIHAKHGSKRQALSFACRHWRIWHGAQAYTNEPYIHIGSHKVQAPGRKEKS